MAGQELDPWQFRISEQADERAIRVGNLFLETGPGLDAIRVRDRGGAPAGILLGFPIDLESGALLSLSREHGFAFQLEDGADEFAEQVISSLAGRFIFILETRDILRVYLDCTAQISCVFDPEMKIAASSSHALFDEQTYDRRFDRALYEQLDVEREGWLPFGLTAHSGVHRVLPNHYLDLHSWSVRRHWPKAEIAVCDNPMDKVEEMVSLVRTQLAALSRGPHKLIQGLTAGYETRVLLACAKPLLRELEFVTITGPDRHECDTRMARRIARDLGLRHKEIPRVLASGAQSDLFIRRGGHCIGDSNALYHPSIWPLAEKYVLAGGAGGEVGRAFFWHSSDTPDTVFSAERVLGRLGLPKTDLLVQRGEAWLGELPSDNAFALLDLAYIEQRMGPWAGAQFCCDPTLIRISPFLNRPAVELMLSLPPDWKRANRLFDQIIERNWPELGRYPYNSLGLFRDTVIKAKRVMNNPAIVVKKLRKMTS